MKPVVLGLACAWLAACGGKAVEPATAADAAKTAEVDALALLPADAVGVGTLNVRAMFAAGESGPALGRLVKQMSPVGEESGVSLEKDVDRLWCASYSLQTADVLCAAEGRFDEERIAKAVEEAAAGHADGKALVKTPYAGRTLYTVSNVGFTVVSPGRALLGTENAMRRSLDRLRDGTPSRQLPAELEKKLVGADSPGGPADIWWGMSLDGATLNRVSLGFVKLRSLEALRAFELRGAFHREDADDSARTTPGLTLHGRVGYADADGAKEGETDFKRLLGLANLASVTGMVPKVREPQSSVIGSELSVKLAFDDAALHGSLRNAAEAFGGGKPGRSRSEKVPGADAR